MKAASILTPALSGPRTPRPGQLGVADLLLVDGDPIAYIKLIDTP